jgi:hypothetical protein
LRCPVFSKSSFIRSFSGADSGKRVALRFSDFGGHERVASPPCPLDFTGAKGMKPEAGDLFSYQPWSNLGFLAFGVEGARPLPGAAAAQETTPNPRASSAPAVIPCCFPIHCPIPTPNKPHLQDPFNIARISVWGSRLRGVLRGAPSEEGASLALIA